MLDHLNIVDSTLIETEGLKDITNFIYRNTIPLYPKPGTYYWVEEEVDGVIKSKIYYTDSNCVLKRIDYEEELNELSDHVEEEVDRIDTRITDEVDTLNERITNEVNTLNTTITGVQTELNDRVTKEVNTLNTTIKGVQTELNDRVTKEVNTINTTIKGVQKELNDKIDDEVDTLNKTIDGVQQRITDEVDTINTKIKGVQTDLKNKIEGVQTDLDNKIQGVQAETQTKIEGVQTDLDNKIQGVQTETQTKIEGVQTYFNNEVAGLQSRLQGVQTETQTKISGVQTETQTKIEGVQTQFTNKINDLTKKHNDEIKGVQKQFEDNLADGILYKPNDDYYSNAIGDIPSKQTKSANIFGHQTFSQIFDKMIFQTVHPTIIEKPYMTISYNGNTEDGQVIMLKVGTSFGESQISGETSRGKVGYVYNDGVQELIGDGNYAGTPTIKNVITKGSTSSSFGTLSEGKYIITRTITFANGQTLKNNKGGASNTPSYTQSSMSATKELHVVYPIYTNTGLTTFTEQPIDDYYEHDAEYIVTIPRESKSNKFEIHIHESLTGRFIVRQLNPLSNTFGPVINMIPNGTISYDGNNYGKFKREVIDENDIKDSSTYKVIITKI